MVYAHIIIYITHGIYTYYHISYIWHICILSYILHMAYIHIIIYIKHGIYTYYHIYYTWNIYILLYILQMVYAHIIISLVDWGSRICSLLHCRGVGSPTKEYPGFNSQTH